MAVLNGYGNGMQYVNQGQPAMGVGGPTVARDATANTVTIDGTPVRVVVLALAAAAGLTALKLAGFRFNVGVST